MAFDALLQGVIYYGNIDFRKPDCNNGKFIKQRKKQKRDG